MSRKPRYVRTRRGTVHRAGCPATLIGDASAAPWRWATGKTPAQLAADRAAPTTGYAFCAVCVPDLPEGGRRPKPRRRRLPA